MQANKSIDWKVYHTVTSTNAETQTLLIPDKVAFINELDNASVDLDIANMVKNTLWSSLGAATAVYAIGKKVTNVKMAYDQQDPLPLTQTSIFLLT